MRKTAAHIASPPIKYTVGREFIVYFSRSSLQEKIGMSKACTVCFVCLKLWTNSQWCHMCVCALYTEFHFYNEINKKQEKHTEREKKRRVRRKVSSQIYVDRKSIRVWKKITASRFQQLVNNANLTMFSRL